jgi:ATP-binding cassette, subfamily B, bacterial MsbA
MTQDTQAPGDAAAKVNATVVYRRLLGYARPWCGLFMIGVLGMIIYAAAEASIVWFVDKFLEYAFVDPDPRVVWAVPLGAFLVFLFRGIGDYLATYFPGRVGRHVVQSIRADLFAQYLHLPAAYYDRESTGKMLSRLVFDAEQVAEATTNSVTVLIRDSLLMLGLLVTMFIKSWQFTLLALVAAPIIGWVLGGVNRRFRRYSARIQQSMGEFTRVAKESIEGHRLIKVYTAEQVQQARFNEVNEQNRRSNERLINARAASGPVVQMVAALGLIAVLALAISQVVQRQVKIDEFMAYLTALLMIMPPLRRLVNVGGPLQQGIAAGAGIFTVLDEPREPAGGSRPLVRARGDVEFRNVGFTYPGSTAAALKDVSVQVPHGKTLAIVGKSGGGKSTLVGLVPRLHDVTAGCVLLDGRDVREYGLGDLRRQISYVGQDVTLFDDTIRSNIVFGLANVTEEALLAAAESANVMEFVRDLPLGLDTRVGDRGGLLSGGQRQRIAIARALLKDAPVLILDEATSALDTESERHIQDALVKLVRGRTTLVIAHRLSTVEQADCIIVVLDGKIVETGTHAQLQARGGAYAHLHSLQFDA